MKTAATIISRGPSLRPEHAPNLGVDLHEVQEVIDGLVEQVALVSCEGTILAVNDCWRRQVERQARTGLHISRDYIAFLEGLIEHGDEGVRPILRAFREIGAGSRNAFRHLYRGSGVFAGYDFRIVVAALTIHGTRHVLVSVHDVTELVGLKRNRRRERSKLLRAQEDQRRRMARELHDSTSQMLVALRLSLSRLVRANVAPEAIVIINECRKNLQEVEQEIRTFSFVAHPPVLTANNLAAAIQALASGFAHRTGIEIEVEISNAGESSASVESAIYRLSQEALANIYRHAGARHATVRLVGKQTCLHLIIADDGIGLNQIDGSKADALGVGVLGMKERVSDLGGRISIRRADRGTVLAVTLPRHKRIVLAPLIGAQ